MLLLLRKFYTDIAPVCDIRIIRYSIFMPLYFRLVPSSRCASGCPVWQVVVFICHRRPQLVHTHLYAIFQRQKWSRRSRKDSPSYCLSNGQYWLCVSIGRRGGFSCCARSWGLVFVVFRIWSDVLLHRATFRFTSVWFKGLLKLRFTWHPSILRCSTFEIMLDKPLPTWPLYIVGFEKGSMP